MIPKIIHYVWLSGEPFPQETQACLDTWKQVLPDYELVLWNKERIKEIHCTFMEEAISVKKWAFATDYIRLYTVYTYGGIYLDTDVEVFQSFNPFLKDRLFIGRENFLAGVPPKQHLTSHCFGAEKGHPFLKLCMSYYECRHYIYDVESALPNSMRFANTVVPQIQAKIAAHVYGYDMDADKDEHQLLGDGIHVYPSDYFDHPMYRSMKRVVCIHRAFGSWCQGTNKRNYDAIPHNYAYYRHYAYRYLNRLLRKVHLYLAQV